MAISVTQGLSGKWQIVTGTAQEVVDWLNSYTVNQLHIAGISYVNPTYTIICHLEA